MNAQNCSIPIDETCFGRLYFSQNSCTYILKSQNRYIDNSITGCQCPHSSSDRWCENNLCLNLSCQHHDTCQRLPYERTKCICTE